ncbi:hypothetical protein F2Q68_00039709 [Brassica cretica]|uniref:Uncharacterized protein n=1 Tax=Brassica cretica TaxID=69181 RepID=A0A8S9MI27_BRACR|nr:hypothetical protein F2Q68_00039709 [Brassica cretica]
MPSSTGSNKETQLIFSSDPASLERLIRKEIRSSSIDNNTSSSVDSRQPPSTQTPVSSTDTRSSPSTEDTPLPSIDTFHPISIDTSVRTSIDTEPRDMVATLILVRDERGDLHDQEGEAARKRFRSRKLDEFRRIALVSIDAGLRTSIDGLQSKSITGSPEHRSTTPTESIASCNVVRIMTHEDFTAKYPHPPSPVYVKIDRHSDPVIDRQKETAIDRLPPAPIDRRAPLTYRVQMPKIDVPRLNALRPQPKPSDNPPEAIRTPSDGATDPMEMDRVPMGRTLRKRKEKVAKHLKRGGGLMKRKGKFSKRDGEAGEAARRRFLSRKLDEFRRIALVSIDAGLRTSIDGLQSKSIAGFPEHRSTTPTESIASCNVVGIMTHEDFTAKHPHPPSPVYVKIDRHSDPVIDRQKETVIDRQPPAPIDRRAPLTYRVQMPKIDVARLNALRPQPKPSDNPPEAIRTPSDGATDPMEMDRVPMGRTLRKGKEKVAKHLKRGG